MASSPTEVASHRFAAPDGVGLAWHEMGAGRPVVLVHGLFSDAFTNWIRYGHAARIAAAGFRVVMPDLRAHGQSDKPHDPAAYPPDVLAHDVEALIAHLGLGEHDLGGYSLGGRTIVRMMVAGAAPRRAIVSGMGLAGLLGTGARAGFFRHVLSNLGSFVRGTPEWLAEAFLKTSRGDPAALLRLLDSFVDTTADELAAVRRPVLVTSGVDDDDNGSAAALAGALPEARYEALPGNHMSAVTKPELGQKIAAFLVA